MRLPQFSARQWRWIALTCLILLLVPGHFWREHVDTAQPVRVGAVPITIAPAEGGNAHIALDSAWRIITDDPSLGGFSALVIGGDDRFRLYSDRGRVLSINRPDSGLIVPRISAYPIHGVLTTKGEQAFADIESATRDPSTGQVWLGYESANIIRRLSASGRVEGTAFSPAMRAWNSNDGPEALVRLSDGRFLVIREREGEALLFPSDPLNKEEAERISYARPDGHAVTDAALLPDGRVLILTRKLVRSYPPFETRLYVADAPQVGEDWGWNLVPGVQPHIPRENFEALAVEALGDGRLRLWIASDNNQAAFQRSYLISLIWDYVAYEKGASDEPGASSNQSVESD